MILSDIGPWLSTAFVVLMATLMGLDARRTRAMARQAQREFVEEYEQTQRITGIEHSPSLQAHYERTKKSLARRGIRSWWP